MAHGVFVVCLAYYCVAWYSMCGGAKVRIQHFVAMVDPKSSIINVESRMHCILECIKRTGCTYFGSKYASWLGKHQCLLAMDGHGQKSYTTSLNCQSIGDLMSKYPKAIGGPCSDHGCNERTVCKPSILGYTCVRDVRRQSHHAKKKIDV